jgi:hypothetical protein
VAFLLNASEVAVKGDGHVFVPADAVLDGFGVFRGMDEGLPRVNVLGLVKIAVGNEGQVQIRHRVLEQLPGRKIFSLPPGFRLVSGLSFLPDADILCA